VSCPVLRETWKRAGTRLVKLNKYVTKLMQATCVVNCFRISQRSVGLAIVRVKYYSTPCKRRPYAIYLNLTLLMTLSGTMCARISSSISFLRLKYSFLSGYVHQLI
jgi:hypothetical protein